MGDKKSKGGNGGKKSAAAMAPSTGYPGLSAMREEMERMMKQFFNDDWLTRAQRLALPGEWPGMTAVSAAMPFAAMMNAPKADLSESETAYELNVELPGLDEKDIDLSIIDSTLVLKGEKKVEKESREKDYHYSERSFGSIRRQFPLPAGVDRDAMRAKFSKGVLHVTLPKTGDAKAKTRRVDVTAG